MTSQSRELHQKETGIAPPFSRVSPAELLEVFRLKHGDPTTTGWRPRMSYQAGYFTPDEHYEALLNRLVEPGTRWLDVGCGRDLLPSNPKLAAIVASRCSEVVGVDPDDNVLENTLLHRRVKGTIEDFPDTDTFDLITLRMVAEHITQPEVVVKHLARLCRPGGVVLVYTVDAWAPLSVVAWLTPFRLHHPIKKLLWGTEDRDTFPVVYRMNSRRRLKRLFGEAGCAELLFAYLPDCRTFARFRWLHWIELQAWKACERVGLCYPEKCLLGAYQRRSPQQAASSEDPVEDRPDRR